MAFLAAFRALPGADYGILHLLCIGSWLHRKGEFSSRQHFHRRPTLTQVGASKEHSFYTGGPKQGPGEGNGDIN